MSNACAAAPDAALTLHHVGCRPGLRVLGPLDLRSDLLAQHPLLLLTSFRILAGVPRAVLEADAGKCQPPAGRWTPRLI